ERLSADHYIRNVTHIYGAAVAGCQKQQADVRDAVQGLARHHRYGVVLLADLARNEGAVCRLHFVDELGKRNPVKGKPLGIGLDPDLVRSSAYDISETGVIDLGELDP